MADIVFNVAKGRVNELIHRVATNDPANSALIVVLLKATATDAVLRDFDTLADVIADAAVDEADFTNYARKTLTDSVIVSPTPDDTNDRQDGTIPDQVFTAAGGASNNGIVKALVCYDSDTTGGSDANIVPLVALDWVITTDGSDVTLDVGAGIFRAS